MGSIVIGTPTGIQHLSTATTPPHTLSSKAIPHIQTTSISVSGMNAIASSASPTVTVLKTMIEHNKSPDLEQSSKRKKTKKRDQDSILLHGHTKPTRALDWNDDQLASAGDDMSVCVWDLPSSTPAHVLCDGHSGPINSVSWNPSTSSCLASVSDDALLCTWDTRTSGPVESVHVSDSEALSVCWSSHNLIATGSSDAMVRIWDSRAMQVPVHNLKRHTGAVNHIRFSPSHSTVLSSCGDDARVMLWDTQSTAQPDKELVFIHGGHTTPVVQAAWDSNSPWTLASVSSNGVVQIWQVASAIVETL